MKFFRSDFWGGTNAVNYAVMIGPSTAIIGAITTKFTVIPVTSYTGTITLSDSSSGGIFTPNSLTWSDSIVPQFFQYTPAETGSISISATGSPSITVIGSPIALTVSSASSSCNILQQTFQSVFTSFRNLILNTSIFGVSSVEFAMTRDSDIKWPVSPPPFILIVPRDFRNGPEDVGGGRYSKTWEGEIELDIVVRDIYDPSYKDTFVFQTTNSGVGPYVLAQNLINLLEQSYPVDGNGHLSLIELPIIRGVEAPFRFSKAQEYVGLPIVIWCKWWECLSADLP